MAGIGLAVVLGCALVGIDPAYVAAVKESQAQQRPLVVLVGAEWCPACVTLKKSILPGLAKRGGLRSVTYATVDADAEPELARQLMRGNGVPQLIVFHQSSSGKWQRAEIIGPASEAEVQSLIEKAVAKREAGTETGGN